jgi:hypothetical protein
VPQLRRRRRLPGAIRSSLAAGNRIHEQRGVLSTEMDRVLPGRVPLDLGEWSAPERLHLPDAAVLGEDDDALIGSSAVHTSPDGVERRRATGVGPAGSS